jgi:hypothetical protein
VAKALTVLSDFVVDIAEDIARLIRDRAVIIYDNALRNTKIACSFEFVSRIAELPVLNTEPIAVVRPEPSLAPLFCSDPPSPLEEQLQQSLA